MNKIILALLMAAALSTAFADQQAKALAANVSGDYAAELKITRPLAANGVAWAQLALGDKFANGQGVVQDYAEAVKWYRLAAEQGHTFAQFRLGFLIYNGQGVVQNYADAAKWYLLAAAQGDASAQLNLGLLHADGQGVTQDYKKAHMWLNLAAVKGNKTSVNARNDVAKRMTPQQIGEAQTMARQCMERNFKGCD